jgi:hypothetical protein
MELSTAGLPQDDGVKWTYLNAIQIAGQLSNQGIIISAYHVRQMLKVRGYKKRKFLKMKELSKHESRNEQFEKITVYRQYFTEMNFPVISIDTKKKEMLGNFHRQGTHYSTGTKTVYDHDFPGFSQGQIVPHGIYDVNKNLGFISLGNSKDTSGFVCDNLLRVWNRHLKQYYSNADTIMILCDGGGSNASGHYIVKQDLCKLANAIDMNLLIVHYPPYCSKYKPMEHRLFSQVSRAWQGVPFYNIQFVKELTDRIQTKTGLKVISDIIDKIYLNKRSVQQDCKNNFNNQITLDDKLPKWNYLIKPKLAFNHY